MRHALKAGVFHGLREAVLDHLVRVVIAHHAHALHHAPRCHGGLIRRKPGILQVRGDQSGTLQRRLVKARLREDGMNGRGGR